MSLNKSNSKRIWLDTDISMGLPEAEVDDGIALIQALNSPEINVSGVSVVFGNTTVDNSYHIGREIVTKFGSEIYKVYRGASSSKDLGRSSEAVNAMVDALKEKSLTIVALGPVTNIASLVLRYPELVERIEEVVVVASRRLGQQLYTGESKRKIHRDFNFEMDFEAMKILLNASIQLVFTPWEISSKIKITQQDLINISQKCETGAWIASKCQSWLELWQRKFDVDYFCPFDSLAISWITHPHLIKSMEVNVWIEEDVDDRTPYDKSKIKPYLLVKSISHKSRKKAIYCYEANIELKNAILESICK